jgi:general secretion pathway protein H
MRMWGIGESRDSVFVIRDSFERGFGIRDSGFAEAWLRSRALPPYRVRQSLYGPESVATPTPSIRRALANPESRIPTERSEGAGDAVAVAAQRPNPGSTGFSLIELLVVLVIIAAVTGAVVLRLGGGDERALQREAERLAALVQLGCERAERVGRDLGVRVDAEGYRFGWLAPQGFAPVAGEAGEALRARGWERPLQVRVVRDGRQLATEGEAPQFGCSARGELTAFRVELRGEDGAGLWTVEGGPGRPARASRGGG